MPDGDDDLGDGMQCSDHPLRSNPGGICAFCLQDKLSKLASSDPPSFRSHFAAANIAAAPPSSLSHKTPAPRIPFLLPKKKKKLSAASLPASDLASSAVLKRSKSTAAAPRRPHFLDDDDSPRKRGGFWSFLHLKTSAKPPPNAAAVTLSSNRNCKAPPNAAAVTLSSNRNCIADVDIDGSPISRTTAASASRRVSRSRSVGCGSRSFSGDFFERISTGFGDCTLRRVESQREGNPKSSTIKERVKCGGIFGGFIMTSSSSSSSSSSYWVSEVTGKGPAAHGRSRSWGWALASPMRAFSKPSEKREPNLAPIPSLLSARG